MSAHNYTDLAEHVGHHLECVTYAGGESVAVECEDCSEVVIDFDRPPTPVVADLSTFRGVFADGYTPEDIARVLDEISEKLGVSLHCLWEYIGDDGTGGLSELLAVINGQAHGLPRGLHELLFDGTGDGVIDPAPSPGAPATEWALRATPRYRSESTRNWAIADCRVTTRT